MKQYRFYVDKRDTAFVDFTEEEFKKLPNTTITFSNDDGVKTFDGKQILLAGYKEKYVIITPIENFEEQEDAR